MPLTGASPPPPPLSPSRQDFGKRIQVWWPSDQAWYAGFVTGYSAGSRRHTIKYDDGEVERICLAAERYRCDTRAGRLAWVGMGGGGV